MTFYDRMSKAFQQDRGIVLKPCEVAAIYLLLARLADLQRFGEARDWKSIETYCPVESEIENPKSKMRRKGKS
jgi:hypothetical protein